MISLSVNFSASAQEIYKANVARFLFLRPLRVLWTTFEGFFAKWLSATVVLSFLWESAISNFKSVRLPFCKWFSVPQQAA